MKKLIFSFLFLATYITACSDRPYVIVQIADAQLGFTAAVNQQQSGGEYVNDLTYEAGYLEKAVALVNKISPDAVVFTGDQVNLYDNEEQWNTFAEIISGIDKDVKLFHIPGNHDVIINGSDVDSTPFKNHYGEDRFLHTERGVTMLGLNTNLIKYNDSMEGEQTDWIKASLEGGTRKGVTIIFGHHPFFLTDIDESDGYFTIMSDKRRSYFDMFRELGTDAVYAGHQHESYEGEYEGIPMKTTTSVAYQIGKSKPSVRIITVDKGTVSDELFKI